MKRLLKWLGILLFVALLLPFFAFFAAYGYHWSIVSAGPGKLEGAPAPTGLCAKADPFIATGGFPWMSGLDSVAACVPFGMVRLGPDTESWIQNKRVLNRSGYYYGDNKIIGFSHTRLVGADVAEGGVFRIFPTTSAQAETARGADRFVKFSHSDETAFPGYYGVQLANGVKAEMTATNRVGVHRYTFPQGEAPVLLLDIASALGDRACDNTRATVDAQQGLVTGAARERGGFAGRYDGLDVFFAAQFSPAPKSAAPVPGNDTVYELSFANAANVEVRLALSYVSIENAQQNLTAEATGKKFEDVVTDAQAKWNEIFNRIKVEGGTEKKQRIFYTSLMRAFTMPTTFCDVNGQYTGFDKKVHTAEGFTYYTDFSIWDTFRTVHPLYSLIAPKEHSDMLRSLEQMVKQGGALPRWPSGAGYTNCMFGTPADILVSEAYQKGITGFDAEAVYAAARHCALEGVPAGSRFGGRQGLAEYLQYGYCPHDKVEESVACTIDYAWCDGALSLWAKALGKEDDAALFAKHAESYKNVWNPRTLFFQARNSDGSWDPNLKPEKLTYLDFDKKYTRAYVEGSAMQWRWGAPFYADGLVALWPKKEFFVKELLAYMRGSTAYVGAWNPGGNYWHGNEPYIHAPYLFNNADRPDLTQWWVHHILTTKYDDNYYGLDGNDDGGTLGAWYVFSSLGFYPVAGTTRYELGIPLFTRAEINLGNGKTLTVSAPDCKESSIYVSRTALNGGTLKDTHITHDQIKDGATLEFEVADMKPDPRFNEIEGQ